MRSLTSVGRITDGSVNPLKLYTELGKAAAQGIRGVGFQQLLSDSDVASNLLYRVKLREHSRNDSFHRSCGKISQKLP